ncbi:MAG: nitroreductase family protein, partial [Salibacteraceae bacterium]
MASEDFIPLNFNGKSPEKMLSDSELFYKELNKRRSVRSFSDKPVDIEIIKNAIKSAGTAPSGAHKQPWTFCVVKNQGIKTKIRAAAEEEEFENYHGRMSEDWLKDLAKFGTDHVKPFLEIAPYLIIIFKKAYDLEDGEKSNNYYVNESVGIATGMLLAALNNAGLVTLTHTPSPM